MKLFLINLDRRPERLERMAGLFERLGLEFTRISAVDGTLLTADEVKGLGSLRPGESGCFLSHRECWQRIVDESLPHAAIFEDDLHLTPGATSLLGKGDWIPVGADIVKLETRLYHARIDKVATATVDERTLHMLRSRHAGAGGYIVTLEGARKLLAMTERLEAPVDQVIFNPDLPWAGSLTTLQLVPAICAQDFYLKEQSMILGIGSDLHEERTPAKPKGMAKLWREVKRPASRVAGFVRRKLADISSDKKWVVVDYR